MKKSNKWSEQCLVENTFGHKDENGNETTTTVNTLFVCISGRELFKNEFVDGKYRAMNKLVIPFDFVVVAGDMCPKGAFYELEYTIGAYGKVYRALIQAVDPVTDLPLVVGTLKKRNILPSDLKSRRAWLRDDIDEVCVGYCSKDDGEVSFGGGNRKAWDGTMNDGTCRTMLEYSSSDWKTCNFYYYRGDLREVWTEQDETYKEEKVFVCGKNGNEPEFASQREADLEEMELNINDALVTARDYNVPHLFIWKTIDGDYEFHCKDLHTETLEALFKSVKEYQDKQETDGNS